MLKKTLHVSSDSAKERVKRDFLFFCRSCELPLGVAQGPIKATRTARPLRVGHSNATKPNTCDKSGLARSIVKPLIWNHSNARAASWLLCILQPSTSPRRGLLSGQDPPSTPPRRSQELIDPGKSPFVNLVSSGEVQRFNLFDVTCRWQEMSADMLTKCSTAIVHLSTSSN